MWKILLVEDEPFVRRSIRQSIRWEEHGFSITGEATHGQEALELMDRLQPDIVITDIFMPYMDGLELIQAARAKGFEGSFIMLTCAGEFEYARLALEYGASSYILKLSMSDEELLQALNKARAKLMKSVEQQDRLEDQLFREAAGYMWRSLWGKELHQDETDKFEDFRRLTANSPGLLLISVLSGTRMLNKADLPSLLPAEAGQAARCHLFRHLGQSTFWVWLERSPALRPEVFIYDGLPAVRRLGSAADGGLGAWRMNLEVLGRYYYGCARGENRVTAEADAAPVQALPVPWEQERGIIGCFERLDVGDCAAKLEQLWQFMAAVRMPMAAVKETAERLDKLFARIAGKPAEPPGALLDAVRHPELLERTVARMRTYAKGLGGQRPQETDHPEINTMIRYLLHHYDEDISLQAMAQYVNMDENYLSGLFKKKTGETFINYLQHIRVNEARFYLEQTDLTVAEIGERVGFANPSYFFKIFKRWTKLTPNEYRQQCKGRADTEPPAP
ncbi:helix-turn-helix domain-containing protein [Paenibacillus sonchi]|uniref:helix-turn-helix domain-containing protein n=1 Tax=Paenibacillus sonchi TaxID=373687 RepID=UPI001E401E00|nr:helix-turn-helix domain-containing protein [Paenibacillus sonchi]MCE3198507.1 response regulator [Paenibacillus sonchi]